MCRPDTVFYAGLVGVSGAVAAGRPSSAAVGLAWAVPTIAWLASLYGGDYFDRELDALTKPHRPLPSGRVRPRTALYVMIILILVGCGATLAWNPRAMLLAVAAAVLGIGYARVFKGQGLSGNLVRGAPTALAFLFGAMATQPDLRIELGVLAAALWLHDSGSNLLGALGDRDGDRLGGCATYPVVHGDQAAVAMLMRFYCSWVTIAGVFPLVMGSIDTSWYYGGLIVAAAVGGVSIGMVVLAPRPIPRPTCLRAHELIVVERLVLPSTVIAAFGHFRVLMGIAVPSIVVTILSALAMRGRYRQPSPSIQ